VDLQPRERAGAGRQHARVAAAGAHLHLKFVPFLMTEAEAAQLRALAGQLPHHGNGDGIPAP
jgi:hypothetical protein